MNLQFYREIVFLFLFFVILLFTISCGKKEEMEEKVEFHICGETELPDELAELIEKKKEEPFHFTYENSAYLYLAIGHGEQPRGEYVVAVRKIYETEAGIFIDTVLMSPDYTKNLVVGAPSVYPYVVIRCEKTEKNVFFL